MVYPFQSRGLFYVAAFIFCLSIVGLPFGIIFAIMGRRAHIEITDTEFVYVMFNTKRVPFSAITMIELLPVVQPRMYQQTSHVSVSVVTVVPLQITTRDNKKIKLSLNHFAQSNEILTQLEIKTGLRVINHQQAL